MATFVSSLDLSEMQRMVVESLLETLAVHEVYIRTCSLNQVMEMHSWLEDPDRAGYYAICNITGSGGTWSFTEKDTAFEFKMRWA